MLLIKLVLLYKQSFASQKKINRPLFFSNWFIILLIFQPEVPTSVRICCTALFLCHCYWISVIFGLLVGQSETFEVVAFHSVALMGIFHPLQIFHRAHRLLMNLENNQQMNQQLE